jgi:hypothetical protein
VLFADGDRHAPDVQYRGDDRRIHFRAPDLPRLDRDATSSSVRKEVDGLAGKVKSNAAASVLLYFTGHGSPNPRSGYNDNFFDLWSGDRFSVHDLAATLKSFPESTPIALVMVQCFSGAFANVLFEDADPSGAPIAHHLAGFFAAVPQRVAAGCTPEINEANYRDFTGYFFAALTGVDRMGGKISGADYDEDGHVGMNEAFVYALIHDESIDTPVCTSDTFLRRFVTTPESEIFQLKYADVLSWSAPAQHAALDELSRQVGLEGDDRLAAAYDEFRRLRPDSVALGDARLIRFVRLVKSVALAHALATSDDDSVKARYAELLRDEARNPFKAF